MSTLLWLRGLMTALLAGLASEFAHSTLLELACEAAPRRFLWLRLLCRRWPDTLSLSLFPQCNGSHTLGNQGQPRAKARCQVGPGAGSVAPPAQLPHL